MQVQVITPQQLDIDSASRADVIVLANVAQLSENQASTIAEFLETGGGLLIAPGRKVIADNYHDKLGSLMPAQLSNFASTIRDENAWKLDPASLQFPWPTDASDIAELETARFLQYWKTQPAQETQIFARLETGDPWLLSSRQGHGRILLLSGPLDTEGGTLPTKSAYVSLLHEMLFYLAAAEYGSRNVQVGDRLVITISDDNATDNYQLRGPAQLDTKLQITGQPPQVRYAETHLPGLYTLQRFHKSRAGTESIKTTRFVVDYDRSEADLTPLTETEQEKLAADHKIQFVDSPDALEQQWLTDDSRTELWQLLLILMLGLLNLEIWLTRRLVQGGHAVLDHVDSFAS